MTEPNERVKARREALGMTRADLARATGLGSNTIRRIEEGSEFHTNFETAAIIADALDVKVRDLFDRADLSSIGRPPRSGRKVKVAVTYDASLCGGCGWINPPTFEECEECGAAL